MKIRQYVITEPKMERPPIINDVVYISTRTLYR